MTGNFLNVLGSTLLDVAPIVAILVFFQIAVLRRRLPHPRRIAVGFVFVLLGLALFLIGLERALFPIGETMARQLTGLATDGQEGLAGALTGATTGWCTFSPLRWGLPPP